MNSTFYAQTLGNYVFLEEASFNFTRDILKMIKYHKYLIEAVDGVETSYYGRKAFDMVERRYSFRPIDVLTNADDICRRICTLNSAVRRTTGTAVLPRRYELDSVPFRADYHENEYEAMINDFSEIAAVAGITPDSIWNKK